MKPVEARMTFTIIGPGPGAAVDDTQQVGYVATRHDTPEQARAWCHYMARLGDLIGDRDVRGTVLAIDRETGLAPPANHAKQEA